MNNAEVLAEAEAVIAALYPPRWTEAGLRRLMIAPGTTRWTRTSSPKSSYVEADERASQKARIRGLFDRWRNVLGLDEWAITLNYHDGKFVKNDGSDSANAIGLTHVDWEYRRATIDFRCDMAVDEDDDEMEYVFVHEAMHVLLNGMRAMREAGDNIGRSYETLFEEHTATTLARAFIRARKMEQDGG